MIRFCVSLVLSLSVFLSVNVVAAEQASAQSGLDVNGRYYVSKLDVDLTQCCVFGEFLNEPQFTAVVHKMLLFKLRESGLTLLDQAEDDAIGLSFRLDYYRHFWGDQTPMPMAKMGDPEFFYSVAAKMGEQELYSFDSDRRTMKSIDLAGINGTDQQKKDYGYALRAGGVLAGAMIKEIAGASFNNKVIPAEFVPMLIELQAEFAAEPERVNDYIPATVTDGYLTIFSSGDSDDRIDAYKAIRRGWYNDKRLFDAIVNNIKLRYTLDERSDIKETREAMNALASSGMSIYEEFFKELEVDDKAPKKIQGQAEDSLKILQKRAALVGAVHDTRTMDLSQNWQVNQLANRARSFDRKTSVAALKEIYRNHRDNTYIVESLAQMLKDEAYVDGFRSGQRTDVHAWAVRIVGMSGQEQYLSLLKSLEDDAVFSKVRDYAEKYYEELEDYIEDQRD
ncbi:hypothetical protein [Gilvimarinus polysaccharolyticus]|uniref:hypothetical protein n=1 Tax=Gilvimarinus polysaccharolyticus TaxID=863921 RepID=UPI0006736286|nr:hypothetical protein [Gilvimarinus polysaccharolyticus]